jgi:hypothetical protein
MAVQTDEPDVAILGAEVKPYFERAALHAQDELELGVAHRDNQLVLPETFLPNENFGSGRFLEHGNQPVCLGLCEHGG